MITDSIGNILNHTPIWVWILLIYLLKIGIQAGRPRTVSLYRILIGPLIFIFFTLHTVTEFPPQLLNLTGLALALLLGILLGFWQIKRLPIQVDKKHKLLHIPGSWITLGLILVIFASKFYFGYTAAANPELFYSPGFSFIALAVSGLCTGMFIGRVACYAYRFKYQAHQDLK